MASTSLTFRCPTSVLEAIDNLGKERYPAANTKHGCDRSKTLIDIMRAGIEALNDGSVVLPAPAFVRQQPDDVRQGLSDNLLEARITEIVQRQTEPLFAEKFSALEERLEKLSAARDRTNDESRAAATQTNSRATSNCQLRIRRHQPETLRIRTAISRGCWLTGGTCRTETKFSTSERLI